MKNYDKAIQIFEENEELCDFVGAIAPDVISKAETALGVKFPKTYARYLSEFGAGNFGAQEIYGVISADFVNSGIPDAVWLTLKEREENELPNDLIIIYYTGDEEYYCLDVGKSVDGECPVVSIEVGDLSGERQMISNNFSEFLLEIIEEEIE